MKFMGSKRWMLQNGLGDLIAREVEGCSRFGDLFSGSGAVSAHVAMKYQIPVAAYDLQAFSAVLARAIIGRETRLAAKHLWTTWYGQARAVRMLTDPPSAAEITRRSVEAQRKWSSERSTVITRAYGGHYFSALQALWIDSLLCTMPPEEPERTTALAALICAASKCAAAPGHTAQPFQPTRTARAFLAEAWRKSIVSNCQEVFSQLCGYCARVRGTAEVADANEAAATTQEGDLLFIDPPYSGVHYSRFYHVLETIARGGCSQVSGRGRYPAPHERPRSRYSVSSESATALCELFQAISSRGGKAIVTFPQRRCSNGLSGRKVVELADRYFNIKKHWVASKFSTLGGNNGHRDARRSTRELILLLHASLLSQWFVR